jgi:hypothetical protein
MVFPAHSRQITVVLAVVLAGASVSPSTRAQACCSGTTPLTPARLERHEWLLVGATARTSVGIGSFDDRGDFANAAEGSAEWDFSEQWFGALRWAERGQASVLLPTVQSYRDAAEANAEFGGGHGDLQLAVRWDFLFRGERSPLPGIALLSTLTLPTGTPPEQASNVLGSDATGTGATQIALGLSLEHDIGPWLPSLLANVTYHAPRTVGSIRVERALEVQLAASASYVWTPHFDTALIASLTTEGASTVGGEKAAASARRHVQLGCSAGYSPNSDWRFFATGFFTPPIDGMGRNERASVGVGLGAVYAFW